MTERERETVRPDGTVCTVEVLDHTDDWRRTYYVAPNAVERDQRGDRWWYAAAAYDDADGEWLEEVTFYTCGGSYYWTELAAALCDAVIDEGHEYEWRLIEP